MTHTIVRLVDHDLKLLAWLEKHGDCEHVIWPREWQMTSTDPLSLVHSVLCQDCGAYGRIVEGEWIDLAS